MDSRIYRVRGFRGHRVKRVVGGKFIDNLGSVDERRDWGRGMEVSRLRRRRLY